MPSLYRWSDSRSRVANLQNEICNVSPLCLLLFVLYWSSLWSIDLISHTMEQFGVAFSPTIDDDFYSIGVYRKIP